MTLEDIARRTPTSFKTFFFRDPSNIAYSPENNKKRLEAIAFGLGYGLLKITGVPKENKVKIGYYLTDLGIKLKELSNEPQ